MNKNAVKIKALIEGLNAALSLELKRVQFLTEYFPLYQFITGRWPPKQRKIAVLVNQVHLLRCNPVLVARNDLKYGLKLARDAIVCQPTLPAELSHVASSHGSKMSELKVDSCIKLVERVKKCIREASIPAMERVYCPYPKCSETWFQNLLKMGLLQVDLELGKPAKPDSGTRK
ncbi:hypothetical protein Q3G72_016257 [Acer saccharum]|nr:hypothetical protein Q3G72_016257 [Acer saccharum]